MEENNVAIQVHGLQKSYKELQVLKGVDFDVARGSIFALLGSNGAGKTTIVSILTTLLKAGWRHGARSTDSTSCRSRRGCASRSA